MKMGKGADKKAVLSVLVVMIALATVNVARAIYDTDIKSGTYTQATAYISGTYSGGKVYGASGYLRGTVTQNLPDEGLFDWYYYSWTDDSGYHEVNDLSWDPSKDQVGESLTDYDDIPSPVYSAGMGGQAGHYYQIGSTIYATADTGEVYAGIPNS